MNQWESRWNEGRIGFHLSEVNSYLERHSKIFLKRKVNNIFVPLCGKSLDMCWLAERTKKVVGVEIVRKPVLEFFIENNIKFNTKNYGQFELFNSDLIDIFNGDFFSLKKHITGHFDAIYDRASIVTIDSGFRVKYVDHLLTFLEKGGKILLITLEYEQIKMEGPPYSVSFIEIKNLFSKYADIELLEACNIIDDRFRKKGLDKMIESVILITKK